MYNLTVCCHHFKFQQPIQMSCLCYSKKQSYRQISNVWYHKSLIFQITQLLWNYWSVTSRSNDLTILAHHMEKWLHDTCGAGPCTGEPRPDSCTAAIVPDVVLIRVLHRGPPWPAQLCCCQCHAELICKLQSLTGKLNSVFCYVRLHLYLLNSWNAIFFLRLFITPLPLGLSSLQHLTSWNLVLVTMVSFRVLTDLVSRDSGSRKFLNLPGARDGPILQVKNTNIWLRVCKKHWYNSQAWCWDWFKLSEIKYTMQGAQVTSMQWGAWGGTGMAVVHNLLPRIIKSGLGVLAPVVGIQALSNVLNTSDFGPQLIISPFDWPKLMAGAQGNVFPVFQEFAEYATAKHGTLPAIVKATAVEVKPKVRLIEPSGPHSTSCLGTQHVKLLWVFYQPKYHRLHLSCQTKLYGCYLWPALSYYSD